VTVGSGPPIPSITVWIVREEVASFQTADRLLHFYGARSRAPELKNQIGLRRLRLRRLRFVREQFFLAAAAQNIKRLVRFLSQPTLPTVEAAT
jgi:hypothetical protein